MLYLRHVLHDSLVNGLARVGGDWITYLDAQAIADGAVMRRWRPVAHNLHHRRQSLQGLVVERHPRSHQHKGSKQPCWDLSGVANTLRLFTEKMFVLDCYV